MVDDALGKGYSKRGERSKGVPIMAAEGEFSESEPREGQLHGEEEGGEVWCEPVSAAAEEWAGGPI